MLTGELTVKQLCDILEGRGLLSAQNSALVQSREAIQRAWLEESWNGGVQARRTRIEIDAIDIIVSMNTPSAANPEVLLGDVTIAEVIAAESGMQLMRFVPDLINRELITNTITRPFAVRHSVVPMGMSGETLILAVASPLSEELVDEIRRSSGSDAKQVVCPKSEIRNVISMVFPAPAQMFQPGAGVFAPEPQSAPKERSLMPWIIGLTAVLVLAIVISVGLVIYIVVSEDSSPPVATGAVASPEPEEPPSPIADGGASLETGPAEARGPLHYRITLRGLPRGAIVRLDGEKLRRRIVNVPNDGREHVIEVKARTFEPWQRSVSPTEDAFLDVELERSRGNRTKKLPPIPEVHEDL